MMVSTTAGGRPLKSAASRPGGTHGGSIDLDAGAIWCRAPEKGSPSSEECAREVLSRGKWVRETRSGWANGAQPAAPAPHPPWACTMSVWVGSLGETYTCVRPEASCVPVRLCRGGPRSGRSTAGSGRTRGRQIGLPELPRIDSRSAGSSRDGVATLRGTWAVVRAHQPHDWAAPGCEQHAVTWTACDSRGGDGGRAVTCGVTCGQALSVEVPRGIADERDSADRTFTPTGNKTKMNGFVEISTLLIHSAPKQKIEWVDAPVALLYPYARGVAQVCKIH